MGFQFLRILPSSSPKVSILNPQTPLSRFTGIVHSHRRPISDCICKTQFNSSSKPVFPSISATWFGGIFNQRRSLGNEAVTMAAAPGSVQKSEEEWQAILSPEQFRILRQKGTEYPGTGEYDKFFSEGIYNCAGCGTPLYRSTTKFNSGCGWPAFYEGLPGAIKRNPDPDGRRIEITCAACGGHLGHVFRGEGFESPIDERHCVNSISIKFASSDSSSQ